MKLSTYRKKAIPLIRLCLGRRMATEAREGHRGERGSSELYVVAQWAGPRLVGICGLGTEDRSAKSVWLSYFAVDLDYRGRGIARRLLAATEQLAQDAGYRWMLIETYVGDRYAAARAIYRSSGYSLIDRHGFALTYRKRLI